MTKILGVNPRYALDIGDAEIAGSIRAALGGSGRIKTDDLWIFVEDGAVTLQGVVFTPYERHAAESLALQTYGVRRVYNRITVAINRKLTDEDLLERVQEALVAHPLFARHPITARIMRGVVSLYGRVDTLAEEQSAVEAAEKVRGVRQVVSAIKVGQIDPTKEPVGIVDDAALLSTTMAAIADAGVVMYHSHSYVRDGIAHLRGQVHDRRVARRAIRAALRVPGLQGVHNELVLHADPLSRDPNEALVGRVIEAMRRDGRVSPSQVMPSVADGVLVLSGQVDSIEDHDAALEVARSVAGVREVVDRIRIMGREPLWADDRRHTVRPAGMQQQHRHGGRG
jgi:hyperosmotically inducible periplasmic protein